MALVPSNVTLLASFTQNVILNDVIGFDGNPITLVPNVAKDLLANAADEDLAKSAHLKNLVADGNVTVNSTFDTAATQTSPGASGASAQKDAVTAAAASTQIVAADSAAMSALTSSQEAQTDATSPANGAYTQADQTALADLANALKVSYNQLQTDMQDTKAKYDAAVTLLNEAKADYNAAQLEIVEMRGIIDNMNA